jgi:hypothetical protein
MGAIEVDLGQRDHNGRTVRFYGEWLMEPDEDKRTSEEDYDAGAYYGVARTRRGQIAVYRAHVNDHFEATLESYPSFKEAREAGTSRRHLEMAEAEEDPNYVKELDI